MDTLNVDHYYFPLLIPYNTDVSCHKCKEACISPHFNEQKFQVFCMVSIAQSHIQYIKSRSYVIKLRWKMTIPPGDLAEWGKNA